MNYDQKTVNRMKRIEGQVRGIIRMMEEENDCKDVITQLTAIRSAVDRAIGVVVSTNLVDCVVNAEENGESKDELIKEAVQLLVKSR